MLKRLDTVFRRYDDLADFRRNSKLSRYHGMIPENLGDADGVLIFDKSGFVKKGNDSVGVSQQYCGNIGKAVYFGVVFV